MKRRKRRRKLFILLFVFSSFLFLFFSSAYAILNSDVVVHGNASLVINNNSGGDFIEGVVDEEDGLIENEDGSSNFVGDEGADVNNYIQISGDSYLWRILSIDSSGNLKIIRDRDESLACAFDANGRANDWPNTTIYQVLQNFYQEYLNSFSSDIVQNPEWLLTQSDKKSGPTLVTVVGTFRDSPIGLIRNDEIFDSSSGGISGNTVSSWLNDGYQWTMTYFTNKPTMAWKVNGGKFMNSKASSGDNTVARPVIYLKSDVTFSGGTGTEDDPFVVN